MDYRRFVALIAVMLLALYVGAASLMIVRDLADSSWGTGRSESDAGVSGRDGITFATAADAAAYMRQQRLERYAPWAVSLDLEVALLLACTTLGIFGGGARALWRVQQNQRILYRPDWVVGLAIGGCVGVAAGLVALSAGGVGDAVLALRAPLASFVGGIFNEEVHRGLRRLVPRLWPADAIERRRLRSPHQHTD